MDLSDFAGTRSNVKDFGKKKRGNRYSKLKQTKLDARREQWMAQVNSKEGKEDYDDRDCEVFVDVRRTNVGIDVKNVEVGGEGKKKSSQQLGGYCDLSPSNSPGSYGSMLMSNSSGTGFSRSSVSSGGCCSGSITEEEEEENEECLDDWEAVADALGIGDKKTDPSPESEPKPPVCQREQSSEFSSEGNSIGNRTRPESLQLPVNRGDCKAWKMDDAFRPQTLPNLAKRFRCPVNSNVRCESGGCSSWVRRNLLSVPSSCPICYEDLDMTDTSFLPCLCGFHLCLFCHKRILEEDGRCPGCRKPYEKVGSTDAKPILKGGSSSISFARSFSMVTGPRK